MEWKEFETVQRWLSGVRASHTGSATTIKYYLRWFGQFCEWAGKNPDQLIAERKEELKSDDEAVKRRAEERLQRFTNYLETEKGLSRKSSNAYHATVRSFYSYNYVELKMRTPRAVSGGGVRPHTIEEIQRLLAYANPREKVTILLLVETGMSREDVVELTYGHIRREYEQGKQFIHMEVVREKEKVRHDAFLGPNAVEALRTDFEMRERVDNETFTDATPLLKSTTSPEPIKLSRSGLSALLARLGKKAGVRTSPHRFRKFFESSMGLVAPSLLIKYWMGHSLGVEKSYFIPHVEEQRKAYMEAYQKIDVYKKETVATIEDQTRLARELLKAAGLDPDRLLIRAQKAVAPRLLTPREQLEAYMKALEKKRTEANGGNCADGKSNQKIVSESALQAMLAEGWRVAAVLPSGKVVVER